jgi:hypothetical protein
MVPVIFQDPMVIRGAIVNASGVIATPTSASKGGRVPFELGFNVVTRVVAPAMESTQPRAAAAMAADLTSALAGEASMIASTAAAARGTGVRWRSDMRAAAGRLTREQSRWRNAADFIAPLDSRPSASLPG